MDATRKKPSGAAFDGAATDYDQVFSHTAVGQVLRRAVWRQLATAYPPGGHILELGCGTGEDAVWLAGQGFRVTATDASAAMLEQAERKVAAAGLDHRVRFEQLDLSTINSAPPPKAAPFDGVLSNFGAINCLEDRSALARILVDWLAPGARVVAVVMGPVCAWEICWFCLRLQPHKAFRRLGQGRTVAVGGGRFVRVWYPGPGRLRRELSPWFVAQRAVAIGALVPPPYLDRLVASRPGLLRRIEAAEQLLAPWLARIADHYSICFTRKEERE